jgi:hypothetical protein
LFVKNSFRRVDVLSDASFQIYVTDALATIPYDGKQLLLMAPAKDGAAVANVQTDFQVSGSKVWVLFDTSAAAASVCSIKVYAGVSP